MLFIETSTFTRELPRHPDDDGYAAKGVKDELTAAERDAWRKAVEAIDNE